jgi:hypothetical protein
VCWIDHTEYKTFFICGSILFTELLLFFISWLAVKCYHHQNKPLSPVWRRSSSSHEKVRTLLNIKPIILITIESFFLRHDLIYPSSVFLERNGSRIIIQN